MFLLLSLLFADIHVAATTQRPWSRHLAPLAFLGLDQLELKEVTRDLERREYEGSTLGDCYWLTFAATPTTNVHRVIDRLIVEWPGSPPMAGHGDVTVSQENWKATLSPAGPRACLDIQVWACFAVEPSAAALAAELAQSGLDLGPELAAARIMAVHAEPLGDEKRPRVYFAVDGDRSQSEGLLRRAGFVRRRKVWVRGDLEVTWIPKHSHGVALLEIAHKRQAPPKRFPFCSGGL